MWRYLTHASQGQRILAVDRRILETTGGEVSEKEAAEANTDKRKHRNNPKTALPDAVAFPPRAVTRRPGNGKSCLAGAGPKEKQWSRPKVDRKPGAGSWPVQIPRVTERLQPRTALPYKDVSPLSNEARERGVYCT
ncbi:hypothetical protein MRX96_032609 [Rhipicephalus microplus]